MEKLTESRLKAIDEQIDIQKKSVAFDMREPTIELYVSKYLKDIDKNDNEIFVPDYQREFIWDDKHQSRFIESLFLGLPVPFIFTAEIKQTGRLEIVDGSQRIRTLAAYLTDELVLRDLDKLSELNGTKFSQLSSARQRMFKNIALKMVVLSADASENVRKEMFDRINTSSVPLLPMETRRGIYRGKFTDFIIDEAKSEQFKKICPINKYFENRREEEELLLRFFAFSDCYPNFKAVESKGVARYLDEYLEKQNMRFTEEEKSVKRNALKKLVDFIAIAYPNQGFAKKVGTQGISKPYFEAIAVGAYLALKENPNICRAIPCSLIVDKDNRNEFFKSIEGRYKTHTAQKILSRIDIAKNAFLNNVEK